MAYTYVFQGTPILIQLWLIYYGLAQFEFIRESAAWLLLGSGWWVGLMVLTLNSAAYQTNILIGAIRNLPQGQLEGAQSIGLSSRQAYQKILFPQALRESWPALANEGILLLKASALVSTITVLDLMGHARTVFSRSYDLWVYGGAAMLYILLTALMTLIALVIRRYWLRPCHQILGSGCHTLNLSYGMQPWPQPRQPPVSRSSIKLMLDNIAASHG